MHPAPPQVLKLLKRKERWLVVAAVRFLRTALSMKVCGVGWVLLCGGRPAEDAFGWPCTRRAVAPSNSYVLH